MGGQKKQARVGRPPKAVDLSQVEALARIGCTIEEIGAVIGLSDTAVDNRLKTDAPFIAAYKKGKENGKATLRRLQWQQAGNGNVTMLIWLGKQMLGQQDRQYINIEEEAERFARILNESKTIEEAKEKVMGLRRD